MGVQCLCLLQIGCVCSVFVCTADWLWVFSVCVYCRLTVGVQCLCLLQIGCGCSVFVFTAIWLWVFSGCVYCNLAVGVQCLCCRAIGYLYMSSMAATPLFVSEQLDCEKVKTSKYSDRVSIYGIVTGKQPCVSECVKITN